MIWKILVGNEHGGAAVSSAGIIDQFLDKENFKVLFLTKGDFAKQYPTSAVYNLKSEEPPIILSKNKAGKIIQYIKFVYWVVYTTILFLKVVKKKKIKTIHTTNNHALLICLLSKLLIPELYIISHWRCVGLASSAHYRFLLKKINKIIAISDAVKNSLPILLQEKVEVIYNGVPVDEISHMNNKNKGQLRNILKLNSSEFLIGTIGSFTAIKCHELIIDSLIVGSTNKDTYAVLMGSCPNKDSEKYLSYLKDKVLRFNLQSRVFFITDETILTPKYYLNDLDLFIGATWNQGLGEGFGLIYIEAMAASVPVLAIDVGAATEIINHHINGFLIQTNSPKELSNQLKLIKSISNIEELKKNAFIDAKSRFDISVTLSKIESIYNKIIHD